MTINMAPVRKQAIKGYVDQKMVLVTGKVLLRRNSVSTAIPPVAKNKPAAIYKCPLRTYLISASAAVTTSRMLPVKGNAKGKNQFPPVAKQM